MINKIYEKVKEFIITNIKSLIFLLVFVIICLIELPYVIYTPGGVISLNDRINIEDSYQTNGSFNMSYVSMVKGNIPSLLISYLMPNWDIVPKSKLSIDSESVNDIMKFEKIEMKTAIDNAIIIAYNKAGRDVTIKKSNLHAVYLTEESNTDIKKYDQLLKIDGIEINSFSEIKDIVSNHKAGDVVHLEVLRNNKIKDCTATIYDGENGPLMGVSFLTTYEYDTDPKINIKIKDSEAGSSGGLMLSLAIYNSLVKEDISKGRKIVGTGTIETNGIVGAIDGVKYKLLGAKASKADMFICPIENYDEAIRLKKELNLSIPIYGVTTFDEALELLK